MSKCTCACHEKKDEPKARIIETGLRGLQFSVGLDGVWLITKTDKGVSAAINLTLQNPPENPYGRAFHDWVEQILLAGKDGKDETA